MTRLMAADLAPRIRVNGIAPGTIATSLTAVAVDVPEARAAIEAQTPCTPSVTSATSPSGASTSHLLPASTSPARSWRSTVAASVRIVGSGSPITDRPSATMQPCRSRPVSTPGARNSFGPASEQPYRRRLSDWIRLVFSVALIALLIWHHDHPSQAVNDLTKLINGLPDYLDSLLPARLHHRRPLGRRPRRRGRAGRPALAARPRPARGRCVHLDDRVGHGQIVAGRPVAGEEPRHRHPLQRQQPVVPCRARRDRRCGDRGRVAVRVATGAPAWPGADAADVLRRDLPRHGNGRRRARRGADRLRHRCDRAPDLRLPRRPADDPAGGSRAGRARCRRRLRGAAPGAALARHRDGRQARRRGAHDPGPRSRRVRRAVPVEGVALARLQGRWPRAAPHPARRRRGRGVPRRCSPSGPTSGYLTSRSRARPAPAPRSSSCATPSGLDSPTYPPTRSPTTSCSRCGARCTRCTRPTSPTVAATCITSCSPTTGRPSSPSTTPAACAAAPHQRRHRRTAREQRPHGRQRARGGGRHPGRRRRRGDRRLPRSSNPRR